MHSGPVQTAQVQSFDCVNMWGSFSVVDTMSTRNGVSHPAGRRGLDEAAVVVERIGYFVGRADRYPPEPAGTALKGDVISMKSPRISADGAIPTIW